MTVRNPLSVGEVARILHVSKPCALNWINSGAIQAFTTYGGHHRVWPGDIKAFINHTGMDIRFDFIEERTQQVLIVDDDSVYTNLMKQMIEMELPNVEVATTDDGHEALLLIGELRPQLLILDIKMPKVDGLKVLELLETRKVDHTMKVLVVSGYLDEEVKSWLADVAVDSAVEKGADFRRVMASIATLLEEDSHHRRNEQRASHVSDVRIGGYRGLHRGISAARHGRRHQKQMVV